MTIKVLTTATESYDGLPLVSQYIKDHPDCLGNGYLVETVKVSKSKQWLMFDTNEFRAMFSLSSDEGKNLLDITNKLDKLEGNALVAIPKKTKKGYGADIGIDTEKRRFYRYMVSEQALWCCDDWKQSPEAPMILSLEKVLEISPTESNKKTKKQPNTPPDQKEPF